MPKLSPRYDVGAPIVAFHYQGTVIGRVWGPDKGWAGEFYYLVRFVKFIKPHFVRESEISETFDQRQVG